MALRVSDYNTPGWQIYSPRQCRGRKEELDRPIAEPRFDTLLVGLGQSGVVKTDSVEYRLPERLVTEFLCVGVDVVVPPGTQIEILVGQFVDSGLGCANGILPGCDEYEGLAVVSKVRFDDI